MLRSLSIRHFVIVEQMDLEFSPGFTVLTGETGAGKSILIDALSLALGGRGEASLVRSGAERAEVVAEFEIPEKGPVSDWLMEHEAHAGETCVLRRVLDKAGKSRAFINGIPMPVQKLKALSEQLLDIHGQHAHQTLQHSHTQRALLDAYAGATALARQVEVASMAWAKARKKLEEATSQAEALQAELLSCIEEIREMEGLEVKEGYWETLQQDHARLSNTSTLQEGVQELLDTLQESEEALAGKLQWASERIAGLAVYDASLASLGELLESARIQVEEAAQSLRRYGFSLETDETGLEKLDRRLGQVMSLARRLRMKPEQLPQRLEDSRRRLEELEGMARPDGLEEQVRQFASTYQSLAAQLSERRTEAAARLARIVTETFGKLALGHGQFKVVLIPLEEPSSVGLETVEFRVATHGSMVPEPLAKVASGGELSRISLAIQAALMEVTSVPTLIFDEVDTGIGGRVAEIVGRLLESLGRTSQVLCVTHLPQVAARGHHHFRVLKQEVGSQLYSTIEKLDAEARIEELARMLGGVTITATTRQHAAEMLDHRLEITDR